MKKILEVEDDKKIPLALGVRLRTDGLQTIIAYEPSAGEAGAIERRFDLIIEKSSRESGCQAHCRSIPEVGAFGANS